MTEHHAERGTSPIYDNMGAPGLAVAEHAFQAAATCLSLVLPPGDVTAVIRHAAALAAANKRPEHT